MAANTLNPDIGDKQHLENQAIHRQRFNHKEVVNGTGDWVLIPAGPEELMVSVEPSSGTARIEFTQDSVSEVEAGTAVGKPWPDGDVTAYAHSVMANAVTAVRCVSTADTDFRVTM